MVGDAMRQEDERDALIVTHLYVVDMAVALFQRRYGSVFEPDDLRGIATVALVEAATRYDASRSGRGAFGAYALVRVRGALVDEWRRRTQYHRRRAAPRVPLLYSLDEWRALGLSGWEPSTDPLAHAATWVDVRDVLRALPPRTRYALLAGAWGVSYEEIARTLGVSPERVWQLRRKARRALADESETEQTG